MWGGSTPQVCVAYASPRATDCKPSKTRWLWEPLCPAVCVADLLQYATPGGYGRDCRHSLDFVIVFSGVITGYDTGMQAGRREGELGFGGTHVGGPGGGRIGPFGG